MGATPADLEPSPASSPYHRKLQMFQVPAGDERHMPRLLVQDGFFVRSCRKDF
jgi:hypothetical protein